MIVSRLIPRRGRRSSFSASINYALHGSKGRNPGRGEVIQGRGLPSIAAAAGAMTLEATTSSRCVDPVMHTMMSYGPGDLVDIAMMRADVATVLKIMGLERHQHIAILHTDTEWKHLHVIANRVRHGKSVSLWRDFEAVERECTRLNAERGWCVVRGHHNKKMVADLLRDNPDLKLAPERTPEARDRARNTHRPPQRWGDLHGSAIHAHLAASASMEAFEARLAADGIGLKGQRQGVIFFSLAAPEDKALGCKGSDIGLSKAVLERIFAGPNRRALENEALEKFKAKLRPAIAHETEAAEPGMPDEMPPPVEPARPDTVTSETATSETANPSPASPPRRQLSPYEQGLVDEYARNRKKRAEVKAQRNANFRASITKSIETLSAMADEAEIPTQDRTAFMTNIVLNMAELAREAREKADAEARKRPPSNPAQQTSHIEFEKDAAQFAAFAKSEEHARAFFAAIRSGERWHYTWMDAPAQKAWALFHYCWREAYYDRLKGQWQAQFYPRLHKVFGFLFRHIRSMEVGPDGRERFSLFLQGSRVKLDFIQGWLDLHEKRLAQARATEQPTQSAKNAARPHADAAEPSVSAPPDPVAAKNPAPAASPFEPSPFAPLARSKMHAAAFDEAIRTGRRWRHEWLNEAARKGWALYLYCENELGFGRLHSRWQARFYPTLRRQLGPLIQNVKSMDFGEGKNVLRALLDEGSRVAQDWANTWLDARERGVEPILPMDRTAPPDNNSALGDRESGASLPSSAAAENRSRTTWLRFRRFAKSKAHAEQFDNAIRTGRRWHQTWLEPSSLEALSLYFHCRHDSQNDCFEGQWQQQYYERLCKRLEPLIEHIGSLDFGKDAREAFNLVVRGGTVKEQFIRDWLDHHERRDQHLGIHRRVQGRTGANKPPRGHDGRGI